MSLNSVLAHLSAVVAATKPKTLTAQEQATRARVVDALGDLNARLSAAETLRKDVAKLDAKNINNNIAFNVKVVPSAKDSHEAVVENLFAYAKAYSDLGGMQMQFNVVSSETMRAAMENPDDYRDLLVRISGYNAYFVTLNRDLQMELIERAEYGL